jgi:hypothetical protein
MTPLPPPPPAPTIDASPCAVSEIAVITGVKAAAT